MTGQKPFVKQALGSFVVAVDGIGKDWVHHLSKSMKAETQRAYWAWIVAIICWVVAVMVLIDFFGSSIRISKSIPLKSHGNH